MGVGDDGTMRLLDALRDTGAARRELQECQLVGSAVVDAAGRRTFLKPLDREAGKAIHRQQSREPGDWLDEVVAGQDGGTPQQFPRVEQFLDDAVALGEEGATATVARAMPPRMQAQKAG